MKEILYGVAYYHEYLPYERLQEDIMMMKKAGINVVRIAESTWSTVEPQEGTFDFHHIDMVVDAMEEAGMKVIIGTPTYAVPTWMVKSHPDVLATTKAGRGMYGTRQNMDITNPVYLFYAERVIRKMLERVADRTCVIGFQIDNETKYYDTAGSNVQEMFVKYLREKFHDNLEEMNYEFGFDYWSNRINAWEDFPDVRGTINGSFGGEFEKFQRTLVDQFLSWQADIVREYKREDQFITQNFDYDWRGYSFGMQPKVNQFHAAGCLDIAGVDIYHPTQDELTGKEIAFGGDFNRSLKNKNYLVIETEAQGFPGWTPYKGQLRLQAYSHLASGANSVMYWHYHSIHNSAETYWRGLLSHDFAENDTYNEAKIIGAEFEKYGKKLVNLKKKNQVAILVSNEALTALDWFPVDMDATFTSSVKYNDILRWVYDTLFEMNVECDFIFPDSENIEEYKAIVIPALYAAPGKLLERIKNYVKSGGHILTTFKSAYANENLKVYAEKQPARLSEVFGISYNQFTFPKNVALQGDGFELSPEDRQIKVFMECIKPEGADVISSYDHYNWNKYAAVTKNKYGKGTAIYLGTWTSMAYLKKLFTILCKDAGIKLHEETGVTIRSGYNDENKKITYYLNYSKEEKQVQIKTAGRNLLTGERINQEQKVCIKPWDVLVVEGDDDECII